MTHAEHKQNKALRSRLKEMNQNGNKYRINYIGMIENLVFVVVFFFIHIAHSFLCFCVALNEFGIKDSLEALNYLMQISLLVLFTDLLAQVLVTIFAKLYKRHTNFLALLKFC